MDTPPGAATSSSAAASSSIVASSSPAANTSLAVVPYLSPAPTRGARQLIPAQQPNKRTKHAIEQDTVLVSLKGSIIIAPTFEVYNNPAPQHSKLAAFRDDVGIEESDSLELFCRRSMVIIGFRPLSAGEALASFLKQSCSMVAVGKATLETGEQIGTALVMRKGDRIRAAMHGCEIGNITIPKLKNVRTHNQDVMYRFVEAWFCAQDTAMMNFTFRRDDCVDADSVLREWSKRSAFNILHDIQACKAVKKANRSVRETFVVENSAMVLRMHTALGEQVGELNRFDHTHDKIPSIRDVDPVPSIMKVGYVDIDANTNCLVETTLKEWIRDLHRTRTLVLWGESNCCKTPVSWCIAACVSKLYTRPDGTSPTIYDITDVEALPRNELQSHDVICFQEFVPSAPRGHNRPWDDDHLKILLDPATGGDLPGKGSNSKHTGVVVLPANCPHIVTTNKIPSVWMKCIPPNLASMTSAEIRLLSHDTRAMLKRLCFVQVVDPMLTAECIRSFRGARAQASAAAFDTVFVGENAIP
jgi:hypothetical protein